MMDLLASSLQLSGGVDGALERLENIRNALDSSDRLPSCWSQDILDNLLDVFFINISPVPEETKRDQGTTDVPLVLSARRGLFSASSETSVDDEIERIRQEIADLRVDEYMEITDRSLLFQADNMLEGMVTTYKLSQMTVIAGEEDMNQIEASQRQSVLCAHSMAV